MSESPRTRRAFEDAEKGAGNDVSRLVASVPALMREAERRRSSRNAGGPSIGSLATWALPRLAAATAVAVIVAGWVAFDGSRQVQPAPPPTLDSVFLGSETGSTGDVVLDALLGGVEAMVEAAAPRSFRAQLAVAAIFALGVIFGIALSFVLVHHVILPGRAAPRGGPVPIELMTRELGLDPEQQEKVRAILERGHAHVGQVLDDTGREIRSLLRPDQQEKFDRMRPRSPFGHAGQHSR